MNKKIILGIVCALAIAGVAGIGVMKAGIGASDPIVNVGPFDGTVTVLTNDTLTVEDRTAGADGSTSSTATFDIVTAPASTFADGYYGISGTLKFAKTGTTTTQKFFGIMEVDNTSGSAAVTITGTLVPGIAKIGTTNSVFTVTTTNFDLDFEDGVMENISITATDNTTLAVSWTITGTLMTTSIEDAVAAIEADPTNFTDATLSIAAASYVGDTTNTSVGVYRPENRTFYLRNSNDTGVAHVEIPYGNPGDVPLVFKDSTGGNPDGIAVYRPDNSYVYLDSNNDGVAEASVKLYLQPDDVVLGGTYTVAGTSPTTTTIESVVYRPSTRAFYTDDGDGILADTEKVVFGNPGDTPFLADTGIGVYRASNQTIYVDTDLDGVANNSYAFAFAKAGDIPVAADLDTPAGSLEYGLYRPSTATFTFRLGNNDVIFVYGNPGDKPLVGDWGVSYWKTYEY